MKGIKNNEIYLNFFRITDYMDTRAKLVNITLEDLIKLISEKKKLYLKNDLSDKLSVPLIATNNFNKEFKFASIKEAVSYSYFKENNVVLDRNRISKCIKTGEIYKGYRFSPLIHKGIK